MQKWDDKHNDQCVASATWTKKANGLGGQGMLSLERNDAMAVVKYLNKYLNQLYNVPEAA